MAINWYPGHMHKASQQIRALLPKVDIVLEVLDARIPYSSENPMIGQLRKDKPTIKLLNKSDLADSDKTQQWLNYFNQQENLQAFAVNIHQPEKIKNIVNDSKTLVEHRIDQARPINILITGIPNVGKSSIINVLAGKAKAKTGNEPAVTKGQQQINLHNGIILWDSPGLLWPKIENHNSAYRLAVTGAIKDTAIEHDDIAFFAATYLMHAEAEKLKERYQLENLPNSEVEFLETIGQQRGCLGAGGYVDFDRISKLFLNDIRELRLGAISLETPSIAEKEKQETAERVAKREAKKAAEKAARKANFKRKKR